MEPTPSYRMFSRSPLAVTTSALLVAAVVAGGAWAIVYGLPSGQAAHWWVLGSTLVILIMLSTGLWRIDPRKMTVLQKCLVVSVLLHVLIAMGFSAVGVTRQVVRWVRHEPPMTPSVNLQISRELEIRQQIRQQTVEQPVTLNVPTFPRPQANSPLPPVSSAIEPVGTPGAPLRQLSPSQNMIAPTLPQAPAASDLTTPLLPVFPELTPMPESTPLPSPAADPDKESVHIPGAVNDRLARATSPIPGTGPGSLGAPPSSLPLGTPGQPTGGSSTGSGTGQPFSLWTNQPPAVAPGPVSTVPAPAPPRIDTPAPMQPQRSFDDRQQQLEKFGGNSETEAAVARALVWLSRVQKPDGHWTKIKNKPGDNETDEHDTGITGLAVLCFLAADYTPDKPSPYQDTLQRSLAWLLKQENNSGDLRGQGKMYDQAIGTLAISEAAAMTRNPGFRAAAHRCAQFIINAQGDTGGWRYSIKDSFSDTSVTGWQIMALHSAEQTGFIVPPEVKQKVQKCLDSKSTGGQGMKTGYLLAVPTHTMTAEGAFTRMLLGQQLSAAQLKEAADYLVSDLPNRPQLNYYYCYYGSLALMQMQGGDWIKWNRHTSNFLRTLQVLDGVNTGSWAPDDTYGAVAGRVYTTALATLTLEVYYRYLPLYAK